MLQTDGLSEINKSLLNILQRDKELMKILNFLVSKDVERMVLHDNYEIDIIVCDWNRKDMKAHEICSMVHSLISACPISKFFDLKGVCNCIYLTHKRMYDDYEN